MAKMINFRYDKWKMENAIEAQLAGKLMMAAVERTSIFAEATVKQQITMNGSVMSGNLRNSTEQIKPVRKGNKIIGGVTVGSESIKVDPGADIANVRPSMEYAEIVNARKPFLGPSMNRIKMKMKAEMNDAMRTFSRMNR